MDHSRRTARTVFFQASGRALRPGPQGDSAPGRSSNVLILGKPVISNTEIHRGFQLEATISTLSEPFTAQNGQRQVAVSAPATFQPISQPTPAEMAVLNAHFPGGWGFSLQ